MTKRTRFWIALGLASLAVRMAGAAELGMAAPALSINEWIKGEAVDVAAGKGKEIYVVEFWATWCPPCRTSIPHLTEVQKRFKDQGVVVIGVSDETAAQVKPFVKQMGDKMAYTVALDDDRKTSAAYMKAFQQGGIPHAFIVDKDSRIAWHGHPMGGLDQALEQIVAGTYDIEAAKRSAQAEGLLGTYFELVSAETLSDKASEVGRRIVADGGGNSMLMNMFAWAVLTEPGIKHRDLPLALRAAKAAYDGTEGKNPSIVDTYARALFDGGQTVEGLEMQRKAVALCDDPNMRRELEKNLKELERRSAAQ